MGVATWLWVDGPWEPSSATAEVAGVSATVTARPVRVVWDTGDGAGVTCDGPGTPYDPAHPSAGRDSACTHVYGRSSATCTPMSSNSGSRSDSASGAPDRNTLARSAVGGASSGR